MYSNGKLAEVWHEMSMLISIMPNTQLIASPNTVLEMVYHGLAQSLMYMYQCSWTWQDVLYYLWWLLWELHVLWFKSVPVGVPDKTHWGRVTHICICNLTSIGWDNGLLPGRHQAIIWTNAAILSTRPWRTYFSEILFKIQKFLFKEIHLKILSPKWQPFWLGLNVLNKTLEWKLVNDHKLHVKTCYRQVSNSTLKRFSYCLGAVFAESLEARCQVENEDVVGAAPTGDAPTTSEWSTILFPIEMRLIY